MVEGGRAGSGHIELTRELGRTSEENSAERFIERESDKSHLPFGDADVDQLTVDLYEAALRNVRLMPGEAAELLSVPTAAVLRAFETLRQMKLVREAGTGEFAAVSPHAAEVELIAPLEHEIHEQHRKLAATRSKMQLMTHVFNDVREARKREEAVVVAGTSEEARLRLADAARHCRREIRTMQPGGARDPEQLDEARPRDLEMLRRGVRMQILYQHTARPDAATREYVRSIGHAGGQVRTSDEVFDRLIIFDQSVAFLPYEADSGAAVVYDSAIVGFLCRIHDHVWRSAQPFSGAEAGYGDVFDELKLAILELLAAGLKDEVIARRLGMSARTCRRHIASILAALRADSRFQAGVAAAQAGLIRTS